MVYGRVPPQALELEEAVLGAIMLEANSGAFDIASSILKEDSFYKDAHAQIWKACISLNEKGAPIDLLTVTEELRKKGVLENIGGAYALTRITMSVVSTAHLETHCRIVQEKYLLREMIRLGGQVVKSAYAEETDVFDLLDFTESQLFNLSVGNVQNNYVRTATLAREEADRIQHLKEHPAAITGVPTGYPAMDRLTSGWQNTDLIILAARPSVGKTAFALNVALNACRSRIKPTNVGIFSLEMSAQQITRRMLAPLSRINYEHINQGRMLEWEEKEYFKALEYYSSLGIFIDDTAAINIYNLRAKARRMVMKDNVGLIIIDYLQLMSGSESDKPSNRVQEVTKISSDLKTLAKELNIPIIALSQLNRQIEQKGGDARPQLSHLRESGSIEQDADVVAFLTRPDYQKKDEEIDPMIKDDATIHFLKHRNGKLEDLALKFCKEIQTWFDLDAYDEYKKPSDRINYNIFRSASPVNYSEPNNDQPF